MAPNASVIRHCDARKADQFGRTTSSNKSVAILKRKNTTVTGPNVANKDLAHAAPSCTLTMESRTKTSGGVRDNSFICC
jgi:hypothetical protein